MKLRDVIQVLEQLHSSLMDIALPELDGIATLAEIRRDETLRHIAVFVVTASAMSGDREKILRCGFDGYIPKPIEHELLLETLRGAMETERDS